jgi:hypothetical protein
VVGITVLFVPQIVQDALANLPDRTPGVNSTEETGEIRLEKVVLTSVSPQVLDTQLPGLPGLVERMSQKGSGLDTLLKPGQQSIIQLTHLLSDARNFCATEKYHITHTYESTNGKGILYQALPLAQLVMNFRSYAGTGSRHGD